LSIFALTITRRNFVARHPPFVERKVMEDPLMSADQSGLMPANFTTLAHF
jgi:hypothetical protein